MTTHVDDLYETDPLDVRYGDPVTPWTVYQPWGHGPIYLATGPVNLPSEPEVYVVAAVCTSCAWMGPDRTGDPHETQLVWDDAQQHAHHMGVRCGFPDCTQLGCQRAEQ